MADRDFINTQAAMERLRSRWGLAFKPRTFDFWAAERIGPPCFKSGGRRLYDIAELDNWAKNRLTRKVSA